MARARITSSPCPRRLDRIVETPCGLPDAAQLTRPTPSLVSVTFVGQAVISPVDMRYYWTQIPNGQDLGALRNARFTRTLRLKALTTSRLRHGPECTEQQHRARHLFLFVYSWAPKNTGLFPDHAPYVNYPKVMKTGARAKDQCFLAPKGTCTVPVHANWVYPKC